MSLAPKLPSIALPAIGNLPSIPFVGCAGGDATAYFNSQFGGLPDFQAVLHIKAAKKFIEEQIYALVEGKLNDVLRPPVYDARAVLLGAQLLEIIATGTTLINNLKAVIDDNINFVNGRINEVNGLKNQISNIPAEARTRVQQVMLERYTRYAGELEAQAQRLNSTLACLGAF
jgi:phage-related tail protein